MSSIQSHPMFGRIVSTLVDSLNFSRSGTSGHRIGDYLADIIAYAIIVQVDREKDPQGNSLPRLSASWVAWKSKHGKNLNILHEDNIMMQFAQVRGFVVVSADSMRMFYGLTSDVMDKGEWAHEGKMSNMGYARPPRRFFDVSDEGWNRIDDYLDAQIDDQIMSLGARRR